MNTKANNSAIGKVCIELQAIDSTNEYAKALLSKSKPAEGTVIFAHEQSAGKGQFGKKWESTKGENLTFSVILYPDFLEAGNAHRLNQAISLALHDFFESLNVTTRIKWPNDIYSGDDKLAGILIENALLKEHLSYSVIGIGINVNQTAFSPGILNPVSLKMVLGKQFELIALLHDFFPFLEKRYLQLKQGNLSTMKEAYQSRLYRLNEKKTFKTSTETFEGIIRGVDDNGRLMIEADGKIRYSTTDFIL